MPGMVSVSGAVEGDVDEAVLRRLFAYAGVDAGPIHGRRGKQHLLSRLSGYNAAAEHSPWLVLIDLDRDASCAPEHRAALLPYPTSMLCFRIAVREVEAWLIADRERMARSLGVAIARIPEDCESLADPKQTIVDLARSSRRRAVVDALVPRPGSGRQVGPGYPGHLLEYVGDEVQGWRPDVAATRSDSLARTMRCLRELASRAPL